MNTEESYNKAIIFKNKEREETEKIVLYQHGSNEFTYSLKIKS